MRNWCDACHSSGVVRDPAAPWWAFWLGVVCPACGGDGLAKPPGWPDRAEMDRLKPKPPPPPPPRGKLVTVTPASVSKGGQNPDNVSDARPAPPRGSGGHEQIEPVEMVLSRLFDDLKHPERFRRPSGTFPETIIVDAQGVRRDIDNQPWWAEQGPLPPISETLPDLDGEPKFVSA